MTTYLLEVPLEGGDALLAEVERTDLPGSLELAAPDPGKAAAKARQTFEESLTRLKPALSSLHHVLSSLTPSGYQVELGLKLGGETGMILAKGTAEVNFRVTITWGEQ